MTKKFWNDWQKRIGETKQVYLSYDFFGRKMNGRCNCRRLLTYRLTDDGNDKVISVKFNGDTVSMVIERKTCVTDLSSRRGYHYHSENEHITLNREDIITVEFFENKA